MCLTNVCIKKKSKDQSTINCELTSGLKHHKLLCNYSRHLRMTLRVQRVKVAQNSLPVSGTTAGEPLPA